MLVDYTHMHPRMCAPLCFHWPRPPRGCTPLPHMLLGSLVFLGRVRAHVRFIVQIGDAAAALGAPLAVDDAGATTRLAQAACRWLSLAAAVLSELRAKVGVDVALS